MASEPRIIHTVEDALGYLIEVTMGVHDIEARNGEVLAPTFYQLTDNRRYGNKAGLVVKPLDRSMKLISKHILWCECTVDVRGSGASVITFFRTEDGQHVPYAPVTFGSHETKEFCATILEMASIVQSGKSLVGYSANKR